MFSIARRAALVAQRAPLRSFAAAPKPLSTHTMGHARQVIRRRGTLVLGSVGVVGGAAFITMPARAERRELGHFVPKDPLIHRANVSFHMAATPAKAEQTALKVTAHT
jgi:hypothetical protein